VTDTEGAEEDKTCLVVGLGNPGAKYSYNRHNVGFMALDWLAHSINSLFEPYGALGLISRGEIDQSSYCLLKPLTYMNLSGRAVGDLADRLHIPLERVLVVSDDFQLPFGMLRLRRKGSDGGHNGLKSIIHTLGASDFPRLRIGIGPSPAGIDPADFVLSDFTRPDFDRLQEILGRACDALKLWIGLMEMDLLMGRFNRSDEPKVESEE